MLKSYAPFMTIYQKNCRQYSWPLWTVERCLLADNNIVPSTAQLKGHSTALRCIQTHMRSGLLRPVDWQVEHMMSFEAEVDTLARLVF